LTREGRAVHVPDAGLQCLVVIARFHGLDADVADLARRFQPAGAACGWRELLRAARAVGLRARRIEGGERSLPTRALPALAEMRDGRHVVLARVDADRVLLQDPAGTGGTLAVEPRASFGARWSGALLLCAPPRGRADGDGLRWVGRVVRRYRRHLGEVLVASLVLQVLGLLTPLFTQVVIDKVLVHRGLTTLDVLAVGMAVVIALEAALGTVRGYLLSHTSSRIDTELGARLMRHLLALPMAYFAVRRAGDTVARLRDLDHLRHALTGAPLTAALDVLFTAVFIAAMAIYSPRLTAVVLVALVLFALLALATGPWLRRRLEERLARGGEVHALAIEVVRGIETVKALAIESRMSQRWDECLAAQARAAFRADHLAQLVGQAAGLLARATALAVLWAGARLVIAGELTIGELVAFNLLAARVTGPVLRLVQAWHDLQQARVSATRLDELLAAPRERGGARGASAGAASIVFDHVRFAYRPDGADVLREVSFTIRPGEVVALVGASGSGKSTVARLLSRLYAPTGGRILIDGVDAATLDPGWLRRWVALVPQETALFSGSVHENIAIADPAAASPARVVSAARLAGAHDFIAELPGGYEAPVGEHGAALSGGQRQRLALARAVLADPAVLVLDESTSALDPESERAIQESLGALARGRTVVIIAHRASMVWRSRRVLVLDGGRIVEEGTPSELATAGGRFAALFGAPSRRGAAAGPDAGRGEAVAARRAHP
jgi:subfamily B ATP-binding cassette protein HlyB/CyaB